MVTDESPADRSRALREPLSPGTSRRRFLRLAGTTGYGLGLATLLGVDDFLAAGAGRYSCSASATASTPPCTWPRTGRISGANP